MGRPRKRIDLELVTHPQARDLISRLLSRDPADRPDEEQILAHEFIQMYSGALVEPLSEFKHTGFEQLVRQAPDSTHAVVRKIVKGETLLVEGEFNSSIFYIKRGSFSMMQDG